MADAAVLEELADETAGVCLGGRNYWSPELHARLRERGLEMLAPFKKATSDPAPARSRAISSIRYQIETVFSQLCERFSAKRVRARDTWHLAGRLLRKVLAHTVGVILNREQGNEPLRLAEVLRNKNLHIALVEVTKELDEADGRHLCGDIMLQ